MERDLNSSHVEDKSENALSIIYGGQVTDSDLLKAGVDAITEDDVANVDLVKLSTLLDPFIHLLTLY